MPKSLFVSLKILCHNSDLLAQSHRLGYKQAQLHHLGYQRKIIYNLSQLNEHQLRQHTNQNWKHHYK